MFPQEMLFTLKDIADKFELLLRNWFNKTDKLGPVYDLYFGALYNPHMYLQQRFLSLVQALESYHRRLMRTYELVEEDHRKRMEAILASAPEAHRDWLASRLKYANEPTLRVRLHEIFAKCSFIMSKIVAKEDAFIEKVVATRHYLTHFDPELEDRSAKDDALHYVTEKLRVMMEACLLEEIGLEPDVIESFFSKSIGFQRRLRSLKSQNAVG